MGFFFNAHVVWIVYITSSLDVRVSSFKSSKKKLVSFFKTQLRARERERERERGGDFDIYI